MDAANKALDAAGYTAGTDGIRVDPKSKQPLVFEHCTSTAGFRQLGGDYIAGALQKIGMKLNLNFVDSTTILFANWPDVKADTKCNLSHGNYDTSEFAYVLAFDLYGDYYYSYHSEQIPTDANKGNGYNYLRLINSDMDAATRRPQEGHQARGSDPGGLQDPGRVHRPDPRGRPLLPQRSAWCGHQGPELPQEPLHGLRYVEYRRLVDQAVATS